MNIGFIQWVGPDGIARFTPRRPVDLSTLIACMTCRATVIEPCRTSTGHTRADHDGRVAPRLCPCGRRRSGPKARLCRRCRTWNHRIAKAAFNQRRRDHR